MAKQECLTITKSFRLGGPKNKTAITTHTYELLGTEGTTRIILVIEVEEYSRKKVVRQQAKRMDLETGHYTHETPWDDTQKRKWLDVVDEWLALPIKEVYSASTGLSQFETRYLKV